jgi:hypothetical protein
VPSEQTAVVPGGTTIVLLWGGGGLLLLKLRHPPSSKGSNRVNRQRRMAIILTSSCNLGPDGLGANLATPTDDDQSPCVKTVCASAQLHPHSRPAWATQQVR